MILDTNAVSDLLQGNAELAVVLDDAVRHHLPVIVLGEYRYGLTASSKKQPLADLLDRLESDSFPLDVDTNTARVYADIRRELKTAGRPIPENDIWIAALARQHRLAIVSKDDHFDHVKGITRFSW